MTNQEARGILVGLEAAYRDLDPLAFTDDGIQLLNERIEAVGVAISALEKQDAPDANVGDTISRQAAIDVFKDTTYTKNEICRRITELPSAQPEQRWIPVAERLPEKGQKCLVSDKGHITIDVFWGRGGAYNWQFYTRDYEAWMPLVKPYSAEGRTDSDGRD